MRLLSINLLTVLTLVLSATSASAFEVRMSPRNSAGPLAPGDTVTVDMFFDANQTGIILFSVALLFDPTFLTYEADPSAALPVIYPAESYLGYGTTGAEPGNLLYSPPVMTTPMAPYVALLPLQTPAWLLWPVPPVNKNQVNVNYTEVNITDTFNTRTTGNNIWIASMVLRVNVDAPNGDTPVTLCNTCGGNILQVGDVEVPPATIPLTGNFTVTVPEPASLALGAAAIVSLSLYAVRMRRRRS